jgi:hypothetical protein
MFWIEKLRRQRGMDQLSGDVRELTLSPGERAGVRAGVITNFMTVSEASSHD